MEMSMDTIMEEDEYTFDSNTDAIVYGVSNPSRSDESMISGLNISSSSSDDDISHQQQQQQQISTVAVAGDGTDDLTVSSCASSSWFMDNSNNNKHIEQKEVMIFNVDFGELSQVAVGNSSDNEIINIEERVNLNSCRGNEPIEDPLSSWYSFWHVEDFAVDINEIVLSPFNCSSLEEVDDNVNFELYQ